MSIQYRIRPLTIALAFAWSLQASSVTHAADEGWSLVPYIGISQLGDQSPQLAGADGIANGNLDIAVDSGFTAGLGLRYGYENSRWTSEFGWEYRSNDSTITAADGTELPSGNYASTSFYVNGRYALTEGSAWTPWVGAGLSWLQEVDLDSEGSEGERSFSDSSSVGLQLLAGIDYNLSDQLYLTSEIRYANHTGIDLEEEGGSGRVTDIDYQPVTLGLGLGWRF
ncbi:MAG: OmpW family outer membrane protein [Granulosicoccus sp.]